jgi:hypothetical protein
VSVAVVEAWSRCKRAELDVEELVWIDAHGGEVPGDFEADEAVQAAPDEDGAQGGRRVDAGVVWSRPG